MTDTSTALPSDRPGWAPTCSYLRESNTARQVVNSHFSHSLYTSSAAQKSAMQPLRVCHCVRVACRSRPSARVCLKVSWGVWGGGGRESGGEMNLGKMGIQICEKLREGLGWRQIGSCHKWDSGAGGVGEGGSTVPPGDHHSYIQLTVCQSRPPPFPSLMLGKLETSDKLHPPHAPTFKDSKPAPLFILSPSLAAESHFSRRSPLFGTDAGLKW